MSKSNVNRPITRSQSQSQALNQPSGSRLNRSIQSTKDYLKGLLPSRTITKDNSTITESPKNKNSKIDKSQISGPINTSLTTPLHNSHLQEQSSIIFENNSNFKTSSPTDKNQKSLLETPILDKTEPIIPQKNSSTEPIYENTRDSILRNQEIAIRQDIYNLAEQNLNNLNDLINLNLNNFNQEHNNNNTNMANDKDLEIRMALDEVETFDGKTPDIFTWIKQVEKAAESLQNQSMPRLLNLLRHKVKDCASETIRKINFESIPEFTHHFERLFGKNIDHLDLLNKIGNIYQFKNEPVLSYQLRLENLIERTTKAYELSVAREQNARELIRNFNNQLEKMAKKKFMDGFLPEIECRLSPDFEQSTLGEIARKASSIEEKLEKFKNMRHEIQPIFKNESATEIANIIIKEKCEKCFSTDHKTLHCPETIQENFDKLQKTVETFIEKTVLAFENKNNQNQETQISPQTQKYTCINHPNLSNHNTDQCFLNRPRNNSNNNNRRNFRSNNNNNSNNSRNQQARQYSNNNNGNNNNNNNNRNYNPNQNGNQGRRNFNKPRNNNNNHGQNYQNGCTHCGNPYHKINNCAQYQLLQANHFYGSGNRSPAFMAGGQGAGMTTPQHNIIQGNQQALPLNFQIAQ